MAFNWDTHGASLAILPIDAQGQQNKQIIKTYENKTISDGGITVDFSVIKVHTSN